MLKNAKATAIIGIVVIVLLSIALVVNLSIIIQGAVNPKEPPSLFGVTPLVVLSGSMEGDAEDSFKTGSMVFAKRVDTDTLEVGDVISFHDPASKTNAITTHRIEKILEQEDGSRRFITKGDHNNDVDKIAIQDTAVVGKYAFHIGAIGSFIMFLQSPIGMLIFIGLPVLAFVLFTIFSKRRQGAGKDPKTAELEAELARLRKLAGVDKAAEEPQSAPENKEQ